MLSWTVEDSATAGECKLTSSLDSGTPTAPLLMRALNCVRPAWLPMSRTHSCSRICASPFLPYLQSWHEYHLSIRKILNNADAPLDEHAGSLEGNMAHYDAHVLNIKASPCTWQWILRVPEGVSVCDSLALMCAHLQSKHHLARRLHWTGSFREARLALSGMWIQPEL